MVAEVMLNDFTGADRVLLLASYRDLRFKIDGLPTIVQQHITDILPEEWTG